MDELKPCPFCGGEARLEPELKSVEDYSDFHWVTCRECYAMSLGTYGEDKAIEAWNRRPK